MSKQMPLKDLQSLYVPSPKLNQLNILREVALDARITQAELASRCSLSVAMVNNYMKDLCKNKLLKYNRKSIKNVTYHLTASGTRHLDLLQKEQIGEMGQIFAEAKNNIRNRIIDCAGTALKHVALYGTGDLAQLVFHALESSGLNVLYVCDDTPNQLGINFCGREVLKPSLLGNMVPDAVIIADVPKTEEIVGNLKSLHQLGVKLIRLDGGVETTLEVSSTTDPESLYQRKREYDDEPDYKSASSPLYQEV